MMTLSCRIKKVNFTAAPLDIAWQAPKKETTVNMMIIFNWRQWGKSKKENYQFLN